MKKNRLMVLFEDGTNKCFDNIEKSEVSNNLLIIDSNKKRYLINFSMVKYTEEITMDVPSAPLRENHNHDCAKCQPTCQCLTCALDNDSCCVRHENNACPICDCPDYVQEVTDDGKG